MFQKAAFLCFVLSSFSRAVELRIATFNIGAHFTTSSGGVYYPDYSLGAPGTADHDSVRDVLDRIDADVVALQEIHGADISANHVNALASSLGYPYVFIAPASNTFDTTLRVGFLSRFPFLTQTSITSPTGAKEMNRLIPVVTVDVPGTTRDPVLVAAHLKSGSAASDLFQRTVEMRRLTGFLSAQGLNAADNFVIMGDFNLSDNDRVFTALPGSGMPGSFILGTDIGLPISYFTNPLNYFSSPAVTRILPRQLDNSTVTFPSSGSTIDLLLVSPTLGARPLRSEIYNSTLDVSNDTGLPKWGAPLASGTSAAASDHYPLFADLELDPAIPYTFTAPGQTVIEVFNGFPGTYIPYPWETTGGAWLGADLGTSAATGFRAYGPAADPALGILPTTTGGRATASLVNQTTEVLTALQISFTAEQWRSANGGTADSLNVELVTDGTSLPLPALAFHAATNLTNGAVAGGVSTPISAIVSGLAIAPGALFQLRFTFTPGAGGGPLPADVFINEIHYDNTGSDRGEFIEVVAGPGFAGPVSGASVVLYNGSDGGVVATHALSTFAVGDLTASKHQIYSRMISEIQNGPDGVAVVVGGIVTQFISYGGSFQATAGPASGMISTDTVVKQTTTEVVGQAALGLTGTGGAPPQFTWTKFTGKPHSPGAANFGQTFTIPPQPQGIALDNLAVTFLSEGDSDGDGFSDVDEAVFGTDPLDAGSRFEMAMANPSPTPGIVRLTFPTRAGRTYTVQSSGDLATWQPVATFAGTGNPRMTEVPINPLEGQRFFRIRAGLP